MLFHRFYIPADEQPRYLLLADLDVPARDGIRTGTTLPESDP